MTTYRHIVFLITIVAFLAAFLSFVPGCARVPVKSGLQIVYLQRETSNPDWRPPAVYTVQTSEGWDEETGCAVEIKHKESGILLRLVPAGEFDMGSDEYSDEKPVHRVKISEPFYIGKYEVTNEQYCRFLNANAADLSGGGNLWLCLRYNEDRIEGEYRAKSEYASRPVTEVTWWGAKAFCEWMGGRLPSEAEWEYACRAGSTTAWCFGDDESALREYAWYEDNSRGTHKVGQKKPNAWGLYDMHGNVNEWCEDEYDSKYYEECRNGVTDPQGPGNGEDRVSRGGSFCDNVLSLHSANRCGFEQDFRNLVLGFRVVVAAGKTP